MMISKFLFHFRNESLYIRYYICFMQKNLIYRVLRRIVGPIKEDSITIYNTDSPSCKTDMPISFIKNKKNNSSIFTQI